MGGFQGEVSALAEGIPAAVEGSPEEVFLLAGEGAVAEVWMAAAGVAVSGFAAAPKEVAAVGDGFVASAEDEYENLGDAAVVG